MLNAVRIVRHPLVVSGQFDSLTLQAVLGFQRSKHVAANGVVDAATWQALESDPRASFSYDYRVGPQEGLADIGASYIGATEAPGNRIGSDQRMRETSQADNLAPNGLTDGTRCHDRPRARQLIHVKHPPQPRLAGSPKARHNTQAN
ncbi:MAG: peptidoglycan binding domain protein [Myxococcaceae bacterium]|nr:peptidoglycan binding domain protein [Myxococcaceae bacterium]